MLCDILNNGFGVLSIEDDIKVGLALQQADKAPAEYRLIINNTNLKHITHTYTYCIDQTLTEEYWTIARVYCSQRVSYNIKIDFFTDEAIRTVLLHRLVRYFPIIVNCPDCNSLPGDI